jgi:dTDP-4-amino-4,6-dideoxy-D-galactose acyltransferase
MDYKYLPWDSEFFDRKTGIILPPVLDTNHLASLLSEMRTAGYILVYWSADRICDSDLDPLGGKLVDKKTTFGIDLEKVDLKKIPPPNTQPFTSGMPISRLEDLALASGEYSRFTVDPKFSYREFASLYRTWMQKSISGELADDILVITHENEIAGMVTLSEKDQVGSIGLIAVDANFRGKKYGQQLVYDALRWFLGKGCRAAQVVTQGDNLPACKLYKKCGYDVLSTTFYYHFWL